MNIDGVLITGIYTGLLATTTATAVFADRGRSVPAPAPGDLDEYEVAFLSGGSRLAATVALVNLERRGLIDLGGALLRDLRDSGDLDLDSVRDADQLIDLGVELHVTVMTDSVATATLTHPVEVAALQAVQGTKPRTPWRVVSAVTATKALGRVRRGLVQRGLLYNYADVERVQRRWRWLLPVLAFGLIGLVAGGGWPLFGVMLLTVVAMMALAQRRPETTRRGDRLVASLRASPASAGMALALAGAGGLSASDPALALAVDVPSWAQEVPDPRTWRESAQGWWESRAAGRSGAWWGAGCGSGWGGGDGVGGCGGGDGGGGGGGCGGGGCGGGG